jgi:hypothetical protein
MADENQITVFAKTNFRNKEVPFGIKTDDRRRHMYLVGKTGMGKTSLMENMVIQDIRNGHGVAFLDPHGDSVQRILDSVPASRINDVIYFNPADLEYPVAFNILESVDSKFKHLVASGLMGVFTKIWANLWSARMEYILNNTILALLDSPGNTLLGITRMYVDKKYRKKIVDNVKDPMVKAFWVDEFANYNEKYRTEAIAPIQNKVGQFLSSGIIRNIVGQPKSTIDLREVMDKEKILIMDLSKGKVGEDNSALLGAMLVTKIQLAAMSRTDIPEKERKDFYLYVDEFQNFATDSFATILSEARKYRLNLIVGHQYIGQLVQDRNTKVRDAIFGNVGTLVVFRIGAEDAEFLVKEFEPVFTEIDIVNLPKYQILLKLMINGVASDPFSATTLAPNPAYITGNSQKTIKVSRERYSNEVSEVEEKISRWMGSDLQQESAALIDARPDQVSHNDVVEQADLEPELEPKINNNIEIKKLIINPPALEIAVDKTENKYPDIEITNSTAVEQVKPASTPIKNPLPKQEKRLDHSNNSQNNSQNRRHNHNQNQNSNKNRHFQGHSDNKSHHAGNVNAHAPRKQNPIWDQVANIHEQKKRDSELKVKNAVSELFKEKPKQTQPENDSNNNNAVSPKLDGPAKQSRIIMNPGQSHNL